MLPIEEFPVGGLKKHMNTLTRCMIGDKINGSLSTSVVDSA